MSDCRALKRSAPRLRVAALTSLLAALAAVACQTQPVYDVDRAIIPREPGWTLEDMTRAIQRAGARRGWDMRILEEGRIEGRLRKPGTLAMIDVEYTTSEFSIRYRHSENLHYTGEGASGKIHGNYNRWIYNLERDIRREFLRMRPTVSDAPKTAPSAATAR